MVSYFYFYTYLFILKINILDKAKYLHTNEIKFKTYVFFIIYNV